MDIERTLCVPVCRLVYFCMWILSFWIRDVLRFVCGVKFHKRFSPCQHFSMQFNLNQVILLSNFLMTSLMFFYTLKINEGWHSSITMLMARKMSIQRVLGRILLVVFSLNLLTHNWQRAQASFHQKNLKNDGSSKSLAKFHGAKTKPLGAIIKRAGSSKKAKKKIKKIRRYLLHTEKISERRKGQFIYCITPKVLVIKKAWASFGSRFHFGGQEGSKVFKKFEICKRDDQNLCQILKWFSVRMCFVSPGSKDVHNFLRHRARPNNSNWQKRC